MKTASALIIGDEILTGKIQDENSIALARLLFGCGVRLSRIEVVSDDVDEIARCVKRMSAAFDFVFTSGGIGPTHDDKTFEAIAKAFDLKLSYHEPTLEKYNRYQQLYLPHKVFTDAQKKMALLPSPCEILEVDNLWISFPLVNNVFVLPGIPKLFKDLLEVIRPRLQAKPFERALIYTSKYESEIAFDLEKVQSQFPDISIGSYPRSEKSYRVMVSLEGLDKENVLKAAHQVETLIDGFREIK